MVGVHFVMNHFRQLSRLICFSLSLSFCLVCHPGGEESSRVGVRDWKYYGGDPEGTRFSALTQINRSNVSQLKIAWTYRTCFLNDTAPTKIYTLSLHDLVAD